MPSQLKYPNVRKHTAKTQLTLLQGSAENTLLIPKGGHKEDQNKRKVTPGFREHVQPAKETAHFWHCIWKSAGRPQNTELHRIMKHTRNMYHLQFKKCQRSEATIKKSKLLNACLNGNGDLFKEIKHMRKTKTVCADSMDGEHDDIPGHFRNIYRNLYNSVNDAEDVKDIRKEVETKINEASIEDVEKVTPDEVRKAAERLKPGKSDPSYSFSSDCLKVKSDLLSEYLAKLIQSFLVHGYVPQFMLLATLVPIVKDKLASINISKNYCSVCITSLILKIVDWITINLFGSALSFHKLHFAYQPNVSSNMCTWAVVETVDYFLRNDSEVFGCSMDKSKAFDLTKFSILFRKMLKAKLSTIVLRLIIYIYISQYCNVRWNNENSSSFLISNGVGQGKILAGYAYCFYCQELFNLLEKSGFGCRINGIYAGVFGYSDDDFFLSPTTSGLQGMLNIAEKFCNEHGLKFSTDPIPAKSKTKCISWLKRHRQLPAMKLCGDLLPWVGRVNHLGTIITNEKDPLKADMKTKKAKYVSKNVEINQEFNFAAAQSRLVVNEIYNSSWYGSVMWDLFSKEFVSIESSYNRSVKCMLKLPYGTHRSLIEPLTSKPHLKKTLIKRFLTFMKTIGKSKKPILRMIK